MTFTKAVKHEAKLRLAIAGPSGTGKTYTSLAVATALANGGKIALVDTEHGSASKYADLFEFDVLELTAPFHPKRFAEAITDAAQGSKGCAPQPWRPPASTGSTSMRCWKPPAWK